MSPHLSDFIIYVSQDCNISNLDKVYWNVFFTLNAPLFYFQCTCNVNNISIQCFLHLICVRVRWLISSLKIHCYITMVEFLMPQHVFNVKWWTEQQLKNQCVAKLSGTFSKTNNFLSAVLHVSNPSDRYIHQLSGTSLVQIVAWYLLGTEPISEPMVIYC